MEEKMNKKFTLYILAQLIITSISLTTTGEFIQAHCQNIEEPQSGTVYVTLSAISSRDSSLAQVLEIRNIKTGVSHEAKNIGDNHYQFTDVPYGDYDFVSAEREAIIPQLEEDRIIHGDFTVNQNSINISAVRIPLTPVVFKLEHNEQPQKIFFHHLKENMENMDREILSRASIFRKATMFELSFTPDNLFTSETQFLIPGKYSLIMYDSYLDLNIDIPEQQDLLTLPISFGKLGTIKGSLDSVLYNQYTISVLPVEADYQNRKYANPVAGGDVIGSTFEIHHVPAGIYRLHFFNAFSKHPLLSKPVQVYEDQVTEVFIPTENNQVSFFSCTIQEFKGRPIRDSRVTLNQEGHVTFGISDTNGNVKIPYRSDLQTVASLRVSPQRGYIDYFDKAPVSVDLVKENGHTVRFNDLIRLTIEVKDENGAPAVDIPISVKEISTGKDSSKAVTTSQGPDGVGVIEAFPRGMIQVEGGTPAKRLYLERFPMNDKDNHIIQLGHVNQELVQ
jgi:hypothetical protein